MFIKQEDLKRVKQLDLLTYLSNYEPNELIRKSRNDYVTRTHSSLHISNGIWRWFKHSNISGKTALDYLIKVEGIPFLEASLYLKELIDGKPYEPIKQFEIKNKQDKRFKLPMRNKDCSAIIQYLCIERCLNRRLIEYCLNEHLIYERASDHAVVFLGYDETRNVRFACTRSIETNDKKDIYGSDKKFSFRILSEEKQVEKIYVFESVIDLLSQITLMIERGEHWQNSDYISLDGASVLEKDVNVNNLKLPVALENYLELNKNISTIILCLDNDCAGKGETKKIITLVGNKYNVFDMHPRSAKDINQVLKNKCRNICKGEKCR